MKVELMVPRALTAGYGKAMTQTACCALTLFLVSCGPSPSYRRFVNNTHEYYARIADGCDEIMARDPVGTSHIRKIQPDDQSLPPVVRAVHPTYIVVGTNGVLIMV